MFWKNVGIYDLVKMGLIEIIDRERPDDSGIRAVRTGDIVIERNADKNIKTLWPLRRSRSNSRRHRATPVNRVQRPYRSAESTVYRPLFVLAAFKNLLNDVIDARPSSPKAVLIASRNSSSRFRVPRRRKRPDNGAAEAAEH